MERLRPSTTIYKTVVDMRMIANTIHTHTPAPRDRVFVSVRHTRASTTRSPNLQQIFASSTILTPIDKSCETEVVYLIDRASGRPSANNSPVAARRSPHVSESGKAPWCIPAMASIHTDWRCGSIIRAPTIFASSSPDTTHLKITRHDRSVIAMKGVLQDACTATEKKQDTCVYSTPDYAQPL
jgi:hypothetical protein